MTGLNRTGPSEEQIRDALEGIVSSSVFADANRLKSFLIYIVEETLSGRRANIRAKLIALDVYDRRPEDGVEQESIVRVDAGRLRRRLDVYYSDEGLNDQIRIHVLPGGYKPTFEVLEQAKPVETVADWQAVRTGSINRTSLLAALLILGIGGFGAGWHSKGFLGNTSTLDIPVVETSAVQKQHAIRSSVNQVSSSSLLARTFVEEARELIFPSIDRARLGAAEILCQRAIEIAPDLSTGHSCDAFTQAYFAFVTPRSGARDARQLRATKAAATALRIDPADADTQMAHAWTQFVNGDRKAAINRARTALGLAPEEQFLRNFYGMMMVFDGQGPEILLPHSSDANGAQASDRYHLFIMAGAYFQASEYLETIRAIDAAVKDEGRTSALMTAIRIAAYEAIGNQSAAERYAANFATSWPERKPAEILSKLFSNESDVLAISKRVDRAMARYEVH